MSVHIPPPVLMVAAGTAQRLLPGGDAPGPTRRWTARALTAASLGVGVAAGLTFVAHRTTVNPVTPERATVLVTTGVNALSRNPMYLAMAGLLAARSVHRGGPAVWLPVGAFVLVVDRFQIRPEERALGDLFGADYAAYRARVPRWLGVPVAASAARTAGGRLPVVGSRFYA